MYEIVSGTTCFMAHVPVPWNALISLYLHVAIKCDLLSLALLHWNSVRWILVFMCKHGNRWVPRNRLKFDIFKPLALNAIQRTIFNYLMLINVRSFSIIKCNGLFHLHVFLFAVPLTVRMIKKTTLTLTYISI